MKAKPENHRLAEKHKVDVRTIRRWRAEGAPLGDPAKMKTWLAGRRTAPTPAENVCHGIQTERQARPPGNPGAPAALRRLEQAELDGYERLQTALAAGNALEIRDARRGYLELVEALRRCDVSVSEQRRDSEEAVPRAKVQSMLSGLGWSLRIGHDQVADALAARLCPGDLIHARNQLREAYGSLLLTALGGIRGGLASTSLAWPGWALEALCEDPAKSFAGGLDNLAQRTRLLSAAYKAGCGQRDELDRLIEELEA